MKKMLLLFLFPVWLTGLTGCMIAYPPRPPQLVDIPLRPHKNDVKIFLKNEKPDDSTYYKVVGLGIPDMFGNFTEQLKALKMQGQRAGIDAILLLGQDSPYGFVNAIGIKYRDSLSYINEYIKRKDVYTYTQYGNPSLVYEANFNLMGEEVSDDPKAIRKDTVYRKYVRHYDLNYLLHDTRGWAYQVDPAGNIIRRTKYRVPNVTELSCSFEYNDWANVAAINLVVYPVTNYVKVVTKERIVLNYNANQQVTEKLIFNRKKKLFRREEIGYDEQGRIQQTTLYAISGTKETPLVTTVYHYYTIQNLPPITKGL